jgi:hypothetical protein
LAKNSLNGVSQPIDLGCRVLKTEGGADGGFQAESSQGRLRTVVAGADFDTFLVQQATNLLRFSTWQHERENAHFLPRGADDEHIFDAG